MHNATVNHRIQSVAMLSVLSSINEPLTTINANLQVLEKCHVNRTSLKRHVKNIRIGYERLSQTFTDISMIQSAFSAESFMERTLVDVSSVVEKAVESVKSKADRKNVSLDFGQVGENFKMSVFEVGFKSFIDEILYNAVRFCVQSSGISVQSKSTPSNFTTQIRFKLSKSDFELMRKLVKVHFSNDSAAHFSPNLAWIYIVKNLSLLLNCTLSYEEVDGFASVSIFMK